MSEAPKQGGWLGSIVGPPGAGRQQVPDAQGCVLEEGQHGRSPAHHGRGAAAVQAHRHHLQANEELGSGLGVTLSSTRSRHWLSTQRSACRQQARHLLGTLLACQPWAC